MKKLKYEILFTILFMTVGIAAVSSNLLINGSTPIASNPDDFNVYFSNALIDGEQDLSLIRSAIDLSFTAEFSLLGDTTEITYEITNSSLNYDADVSVTCSQGNEYLSVSNELDTDNYLMSRSSRTGVLTISMIKSYVGSSLSQNIVCTINASAVERTNQGDAHESLPDIPYTIGDEIIFDTEKFNIIGQTEDTLTLLAQYNVSNETMRQSTSQSWTVFATKKGWEASSDGTDIDVQLWGGTTLLKTLNGYVDYLKSDLGLSTAEGNLITLSQLKYLGCDSSSACTKSPYKSWVMNKQFWWTSTSKNINKILAFYPDGTVISDSFDATNGVRPVITINKNHLKSNVISFSIDGVVYFAREGMYWSEWVDSEFNTGGYVVEQDANNFRVRLPSSIYHVNENAMDDTIITENRDYVSTYESPIL